MGAYGNWPRSYVRWPQPSGRDLLALVLVVVVGFVVSKATEDTHEPARAAKDCVVSGTVLRPDHSDPDRPYAGVHVGFVTLPATVRSADRFVDRGVTGPDGAFRVSCAGVDLVSALALRDMALPAWVKVTDVILAGGPRENVRVTVRD
jgi:hypothetical protein